MRLLPKELNGILEAIVAFVADSGWELYLHGSRANDKAYGGDIDLLLLCAPSKLEDVKSKKRRILVEIERRIGERRIDLTISSSEPAEQSEFVQMALASSVKISAIATN